MKVEQTLRAPFAGALKKLKCKVGDIVVEGVELAEVQPQASEHVMGEACLPNNLPRARKTEPALEVAGSPLVQRNLRDRCSISPALASMKAVADIITAARQSIPPNTRGRGCTWPWIGMRPSLAQFSEPVWLGQLAIPDALHHRYLGLGFRHTQDLNL